MFYVQLTSGGGNDMNHLKQVALLLLFIFATNLNAENKAVFKITVEDTFKDVYGRVYESLEEARFFVVFEPDIGKNISKFSERWGEDYNRSNITALRSMVFCNVWYANQISNRDPELLGLCPLHISLYERQGRTNILFNRPTLISKNSPAHELIEEIENLIIEAIKKGATK